MRNSEFEMREDPFIQAIENAYRQDETHYVQNLIPLAEIPDHLKDPIQSHALSLIKSVRDKSVTQGGMEAFLFQYSLSSEEGIVLMCLAESLLRIPDKPTINKLIRDKLSQGDWRVHLGKSHSLFVNATTWALMLTGKVLSEFKTFEPQKTLSSLLKRLALRGGEPIIRKSVEGAMAILSNQFVMGRSIEESIKKAANKEAQGYRYSYDMLGESAYTAEDAKHYFEKYANAIQQVALVSKGKGPLLAPGISVKLSALHPRFTMAKKERLQQELLPRLKELVLQAKAADINLTIDAEEAHTLGISLNLIQNIIEDGLLGDWEGFGFAVQAYQKRALYLLDWLIHLANEHRQRFMIRLVKGAYWDSEIKMSQVQGLTGYPVFTRKMTTDLNYVACLKKLLMADRIYPQIATHNALTVATTITLAKEYGRSQYEFQRLHGMGEALYHTLRQENHHLACRIYAPVGSYEDLLPYLVRRLLENGANTSFVNRIVDEQIPIEEMIMLPEEKIARLSEIPNPQIPLPQALFPNRANSQGVDLSDPFEFVPILKAIEKYGTQQWMARPSCVEKGDNAEISKRYSPINHSHYLGEVFLAKKEHIEIALNQAEKAYDSWREVSGITRAQYLEKMGQLLQAHREEFYGLLVYEGGKTIEDAVSEVREAIDYCNYYAEQVKLHFNDPKTLIGPTGELNQTSFHGRGIIACISPWNFPLAIFLGQVLGSLAAGNCVVAKPSSQTALIGYRAIELLYQAGFSKEVVQFIPGSGAMVGALLAQDPRVQGIVMTGSADTAQQINRKISQREGAIIPLIAETGGQNAMIVDSSALSEQVTQDVIVSAFRSAGQRCSALRVLFLQEEVADKIIEMIIGAMKELKIGHPNDLATDVGPVIDDLAKSQLQLHAEKMKKKGRLLCELILSPECEEGSFFAPHLFEISSLRLLDQEVFGPILHIIRYKSQDLDSVIEEINSTGYGLTLGIHSRIDETIEKIARRAKVGNIYVNRNMIGAVVGVQPFGGEGLSGTGPKAGGPYYLPRLAVERCISINTTASGGNATLMSLKE